MLGLLNCGVTVVNAVTKDRKAKIGKESVMQSPILSLCSAISPSLPSTCHASTDLPRCSSEPYEK